jgi:hypothetical protein
VEGCSFLRAFEIKRCIKRYVKIPCKLLSLSVGAPVGNMEGIHLLECFERKGKYRVIKNLCAPDDYNTESYK